MLSDKIIVINDRNEIYMTGVYKLFHIAQPEIFYIGSCKSVRDKRSRTGFSRRFSGHYNFARLGKHRNKNIQALVNRLGTDGLRMQILEICDPEFSVIREQSFIDLLKPPLNICPCAANSSGFRHSEETRRLLREKKRERFGEGFIRKVKYKKTPKELRNYQVVAVIQFDKNGGLIKEHKSIADAAQENNISRGGIVNAASGRRTTSGGYIWRYKNEVAVNPTTAKQLGLSESRLK